MDRSWRKEDKIIGADHFLFSLDFHFRLSLENEKGLFNIRMRMGVSLASIFDLP